jgi:hypothetical protein
MEVSKELSNLLKDVSLIIEDFKEDPSKFSDERIENMRNVSVSLREKFEEGRETFSDYCERNRVGEKLAYQLLKYDIAILPEVIR